MSTPPTKNANEDNADAAFIQQCLPSIDPDVTDPFDSSQFSEETLQYVHPKARYTGVLPAYILAQIDLFQKNLRAGCSLSIFNKVINLVQHYSRESLGDL